MSSWIVGQKMSLTERWVSQEPPPAYLLDVLREWVAHRALGVEANVLCMPFLKFGSSVFFPQTVVCTHTSQLRGPVRGIAYAYRGFQLYCS